MHIVVWTPRLDGKDPEGNEIPALAQATDPKAKAEVLGELQLMVADMLRASLGNIALLDPNFRVLATEGVYVGLAQTNSQDVQVRPVVCDENRVPCPPLNLKMACRECHKVIEGAPAIRTVCRECAKPTEHRIVKA